MAMQFRVHISEVILILKVNLHCRKGFSQEISHRIESHCNALHLCDVQSVFRVFPDLSEYLSL